MIEAGQRNHAQQPRAGVLLVNLGTPDAPTAPAIRRYLREFLSDKRVVDLPRALWWPILNGFILPFRPRRLAHSYGSVWGQEGAPLLTHTRDLTQGVEHALAERLGASQVPVYFAMRYGNPSVVSVIARAQTDGVRRLVAIPLYPQYSATTTASVMDALFAALSNLRWMPEVRSVHQYHDDPQYIAALADAVRAHWAAHGQGDHLLLSFHGIPKRYFEAGDPYFCHCQKTARLLAEALQLPESHYTVAFQSRFGREPWLQPYTDERIVQLAQSGVKRLDAICPGFAADCLETLEEMDMQYAELFQASGGEALRYIPALNASAAHVDCIAALAEQHLSGWLPTAIDAEQIAARAATLHY
ncbi:ferrochelatase [Algiphilus sp.]|uniref:ferrochelatase n=1 Tax=Algiphilus sp. TaxID=1872431 RepID=UPI002A5DA293|nr:ferrochelatase [Pseudomonadota bacterium]